MPYLRIVGWILFFTVIAFTFTRGVSAQTFNRVVAIVNEDVITLYELEKRIKEFTGLTTKDLKAKGQDVYLKMRQKMLSLLIDEKIAQSKIKELKITVSPDQVDAAIERIKKSYKLTHAELIAKLKEQGLTYEKYREQIKINIERSKLINAEVNSKIILREDQLLQYYEEHKEDFSTEGSVHIAGIFLLLKVPGSDRERRELSRKGREILRRIGEGEDFGALAKAYSQGPGADEGGDLGSFKTDQIETSLRKIVKDIPEGGISGLIEKTNGFQIIKVIKRQKGHVKSFEDSRDAIYNVLYGDEVNKRYTAWIKALRKSSYTKILF